MRILHTMLRVNNLDESIEFYKNFFGMQLLRQHDFPEGKFSLAFIGYGNEQDHTVIELTHNWDTSSYDLGNGYGHIAIEVDDAYQDHPIHQKIGFGCSSRTETYGLIGIPNERGSHICIRVYSHSGDAHLFRCSHDPPGDLTAIGH